MDTNALLPLFAADYSQVTGMAASAIYVVLALIALWGLFCVIVVWMRVGQKRFRDEDQQNEFLDELETPLRNGDFDAAAAICADDTRALPQLAAIAIHNRKLGFSKIRQLLPDRFQRDVLSDLEYRMSWVYTVIKAAPMVGLLGTVLGMMGAFGKLAGAENVKPDQMAEDIMIALITTASGLAIAIPLVFCAASINVRIRKMEELVGAGLTQFMDSYREATTTGGRTR
jgi:biopolymer transport protein ExbB